jgi:predicted lipoprotein with Yx(FWY)xxD motif
MEGKFHAGQPNDRPPRLGQGGLRIVLRGGAVSGLAAAALVVAACGSSGSTASARTAGHHGTSQNPAGNAAVSTRQLSGIGVVLVTRSGMTVYTPEKPAELNGKIKCVGSCLNFWLPVTASAGTRSSGLPGKLGTVQRPDGKTQLTYNGRPLYTFRLDTAAGQALGNNVTDSFNGTSFTWQAVTASGKPGGTAPKPSNSIPGY